jgi:hypothetical protein
MQDSFVGLKTKEQEAINDMPWTGQQIGFTMTPELRKKAMAGQALFARAPAPEYTYDPISPQYEGTKIFAAPATDNRSGFTRFVENFEIPKNPKESLQNMFVAGRVKVAYSGAAIQEKLINDFNGAVTDAMTGEIRADIIMDQALHSQVLATTAAKEGYVVFNEQGMPKVVVDDNNINAIFELQKQLADRIGNVDARHVINAHLAAKRFAGEVALNENRIEMAAKYRAQAKELIKTKKLMNIRKAFRLEQLAIKRAKETYISDEQLAAIPEGLSYANIPEVAQIAEMTTNIQQKNINLLEASGVYGPEEAQEYRQQEWYIPLFRVFDDLETTNTGAKEFFRGFADLGKEFKFEGSDRQIDDVLDNLLTKHLWAVNASVRNNANRKAAEAVGIVNEEGDLKLYDKPPAGKDGLVAPVFIEGERKYVEYTDPFYAMAIQGPESALIEQSLFATVAKALRISITANPVFQVYQVFNDAISAAAFSGVNNPFQLMGRVMGSFYTAIRDPNDPVLKQMARLGITGGYGHTTKELSDKARRELGLMNTSMVRNMITNLDTFAAHSDVAQRRALFEQTLLETGGVKMPDGTIKGGNEVLAMNRALNIINWQKRGHNSKIRILTHTIPFLNAYIQGMDVLINALRGKGISGQEKVMAQKLFFTTALKLTALNALYAMMVGGDDEYENLPDREKLRSYMIPGTGFSMPVRAEISLLFKTIPELTYNIVRREGTTREMDATKVGTAFSDAITDAMLGPNLMPQLIRPTLEILTNHNFFTGRDIVNSSYREMETSAQFNENTSEFAKMLGNTGFVSPFTVDHFVKGYFGTAGALSLYMINQTANMFYDNKLPSPSLHNAPVIGSLMYTPNGKDQLNDFYDLKERSDKVTSTLNEYIKYGDKETADSYRVDNKDLIAVRKQVNNVSNRLKKLRAYRKTIINSNINAEEKRTRIDAIDIQTTNIVKNISLMRIRAGL